MRAYYDTGVLVPLFVREVFSDAVIAWTAKLNDPIFFHVFHRLELESARRLKAFRNEIGAGLQGLALEKVDATIREGRMLARSVDWVSALEDARRIGAVSAPAGCRTLDLIHIAVALQWRCDVLVSADERQLRAARQAGLEAVDVRALPSGPAPSVREPGAGYKTRREGSADTKRRRTGPASRASAKETA